MPVVLTDAEYKKLLSQGSSKSSPKALKRCPPGKKRNPETNRCKKSPLARSSTPKIKINRAVMDAAVAKVEKRMRAKQARAATPKTGPKRPLNVYQQFMKETIAILKNNYPDQTARERFSTAVEMWREHKGEME
jgi:hypothetical protein